MKIKLVSIALLGVMTISSGCQDKAKRLQTDIPSFPLGEFIRPAGVNPVIAPCTSTRFYCPLTGDSVAWESNDTFNPAATVLDDKVVVFYRAEDKSGEGIGQRTSCLLYTSDAADE